MGVIRWRNGQEVKVEPRKVKTTPKVRVTSKGGVCIYCEGKGWTDFGKCDICRGSGRVSKK